MGYTSSQIKYIIAMGILHNEKNEIRSMEIADFLDVSKPSVHKMVAEFCDMGIITKNPYSPIQITPFGLRIIDEYSEHFNKIHGHFAKTLALRDDTAKSTAISIMCTLSEDQLTELCAKL